MVLVVVEVELDVVVLVVGGISVVVLVVVLDDVLVEVVEDVLLVDDVVLVVLLVEEVLVVVVVHSGVQHSPRSRSINSANSKPVRVSSFMQELSVIVCSPTKYSLS